VPTYSQAQDAVETLIEFFEKWHFLLDLQVKCFKQCTILNYLGMCKEGEWVMMNL
jgi:hypothetical protein